MRERYCDTSVFYAILFDEPTNEQTLKQLDIHIRFWDEKEGKINTCYMYLKSKMLGHATAQIMRDTLLEIMGEDGLDLRKMIMIMLGMDGPNVNKSLWKKI